MSSRISQRIRRATEPVQVREGTLHHPALSPEPGAVLCNAPGGQLLQSEGPAETAELVVVVAAGAEHCDRAAHGPAAPATHARNCLQ